MEKRILFYLEDKLYALILEENSRTGASMSEIIRRALKEYLKRERD